MHMPIDCIRWKMWPIPSLLFYIPLKYQHSFLHRMAELEVLSKVWGSGVVYWGMGSNTAGIMPRYWITSPAL